MLRKQFPPLQSLLPACAAAMLLGSEQAGRRGPRSVAGTVVTPELHLCAWETLAKSCQGVKQPLVFPGLTLQPGAVRSALKTMWGHQGSMYVKAPPALYAVFCMQNLSWAGGFFLNSLI